MSDTSSLSVERRRKQGRSAVTNGKRLLIGVTGSSKHSRRYSDLVALYTEEIGGTLTTSDKAMVRQAATLQIQSERMQAEIINGDVVSTDDLIRLSSEVRRILDALKSKGAARKPPEHPSLEQHIARRRAEREAPAAA